MFAVGFVMRPIGAWLMGIYADRKGRKAGLSLSVALMCAGSLLIAVTPGYASIGTWAPALLVLARMMQGLQVGGEYGASATYLSEMAGAQAARLLFELPICHPDLGPADRARRADRAAAGDVGGGARGLGLADPVRDRRRRWR